jgi:hypothetical protein
LWLLGGKVLSFKCSVLSRRCGVRSGLLGAKTAL